MRTRSNFRQFISGLLFLAAAAVLVTALGSCISRAYSIPDFQKPPDVLELETLLAKYRADPEAAQEKYRGEFFLFPSVEIDEVISPHSHPEKYQLGGEMYASSGPFKFRPRFLYDLDSLGPGFVLDVRGEVRGWIQGDFYITNATFTVVEGGDLPPPGVY